MQNSRKFVFALSLVLAGVLTFSVLTVSAQEIVTGDSGSTSDNSGVPGTGDSGTTAGGGSTPNTGDSGTTAGSGSTPNTGDSGTTAGSGNTPSTGDSGTTAGPGSGSGSGSTPNTGDSGTTAGPGSSNNGGNNGGSNNGGSENNGGSSSGSSPRGGSSGSSIRSTQTASPINALQPLQNISQCMYLTSYLKMGRANPRTEVTKLQTFLRNTEGINVEVTGTFDEQTFNAVKAFQAKYVSDIMGPWGVKSPTGQVYYTTRKKINEIYCKKTFLLTPAQLAQIEAYRNSRSNSIPGVNEGTATSTTDLTPDVGQGTTSDETLPASAGDSETGNRFWNFIKWLFGF